MKGFEWRGRVDVMGGRAGCAHGGERVKGFARRRRVVIVHHNHILDWTASHSFIAWRMPRSIMISSLPPGMA